MKLVFYSGGAADQNHDLDEELLRLTNLPSKKISMCFIPASSHGLRQQFAEFFGDFKRFGVKKTYCFPVDVDFTAKELKEILRSDVIYLGGGNTYYFLKSLREKKLFPHLARYAKRGGVLAGLSAGAIMMTPNIQMAGIPRRTADSNEVKIKKLKSMGLVNFEYHPHYMKKRWENAELLRYSKQISWPLFACPDGSGLVVEGKNINIVGEAHAFIKGKHFKDLDKIGFRRK